MGEFWQNEAKFAHVFKQDLLHGLTVGASVNVRRDRVAWPGPALPAQMKVARERRTCRHAACKRLSEGFMARVFESRHDYST